MRTFVALVTIKFGPDDSRAPGSIVNLDENDAKALSAYIREPRPGELPEAVEPFEAPAAPEAPVAQEIEPEAVPTAEKSRVAQVVDALNALDPEDFFDSGRPKKKALGEWLDFKPTEGEIDAALKVKEAL